MEREIIREPAGDLPALSLRPHVPLPLSCAKLPPINRIAVNRRPARAVVALVDPHVAVDDAVVVHRDDCGRNRSVGRSFDSRPVNLDPAENHRRGRQKRCSALTAITHCEVFASEYQT